MDIEDTLPENFKKIYDVAKKYLEKNPHFTIDDLFSICKRKTELSKNEISKILEEFIQKKIFVPGSRLTRKTILDNKRRLKLYRLISKNPGLNFNQIIDRLKIGKRVACLHLEILKKFGFIRERKFMIYNLYFHQNFPKGEELLIFFLRNPNIFNIYLCLKNHPLNAYTLSKILDLHYSTIQYHLKHLQQYQIIFAHDDKTYSINSEYVSFLEQYYNLTVPQEFKEMIEEYLKKKN